MRCSFTEEGVVSRKKFFPSKEAGQNVDHKTGDGQNLIRLKRVKNKGKQVLQLLQTTVFLYSLSQMSFLIRVESCNKDLTLYFILFVNAPALLYEQLKLIFLIFMFDFPYLSGQGTKLYSIQVWARN